MVKLKKMHILFISLRGSCCKMFILFCLQFAFINAVFAGNADLAITTTSTNGSWSYDAGTATYSWTPDANSSTVKASDIVACLLGSNTALGGNTALNSQTNGAHSVTILTACSGGAGSQSGNVTITSNITAATTNTTQMTFTITAAGTISNTATITMTPASNASTGYPATNVVFTAPAGISGDQGINCTGGASTGTDNPGGAGGSITLTSTAGAISQTNSLTTSGAPGGTGSTGPSCTGGAAGALTITGTSISLDNIACRGGAAAGTGTGGAGGTVTMTASSTTITLNNSLNTTGGAGGTANGAPGHGGAAGSITLTAATNIANVSISAVGGAGAGDGNGGTGGNITFTATAGSITSTNAISGKGGASGSSIANQSGGAGGTIVLTAATTLSTNSSSSISAAGGTCRGTGTSNGGNITLIGPGGLTIANTLNCTAGTGGAAGTAGNIIINDGNGSITSGGVNDGQVSGATFSGGGFTKIGSGNFQLAASGNGWTGTTTITAGKITLATGSAISNSSGLNFNGGRLVMGAFDETVATITISAYSILDMPSGNYTLTCSASNGVSWTAGQKLGINFWGVVGDNYNGTAAGASDPKIKTGASAELDATHLAAIYFRRSSNGSTYTATQLASGEIVPTATLPVELISFSAEKKNDYVELKWQTASEINSDYFDIVRANDNMQMESIGKVNAAGSSNKMINYSFTDPFPAPGINYYQLVEYDFDRAHQESKIVSVTNENSIETILKAYPNPTNGATTFDFYSVAGGIYYMKAFSNSGDQVYATKIFGIAGENRFSLSLHDFSLGAYTFQLCDKDEKPIASTKIIKVD